MKVGTGLLQGIDTLEDMGCFSLTELGYGNNALEMKTTAMYDQCTGDIVLNTPSELDTPMELCMQSTVLCLLRCM